ncbi:MAG: hypothetical protein IRZ09_15240 [Variibacter sp.]|nr:hypothetical protein [Variibacter sp.]
MSEHTTTAADIARHAADIVAGARAETHGDKLLNHEKIAAVWNGILAAAGKSPQRPLDAHDVANLMEGMKIARRYLGAYNADDYVDGAGYAACAGEIRARLESLPPHDPKLNIVSDSQIRWTTQTAPVAPAAEPGSRSANPAWKNVRLKRPRRGASEAKGGARRSRSGGRRIPRRRT